MLNKKKHLGEQQHLISLIQKALDRKRPVLVFKKSTDHSLILNKLVDSGIVWSFKISGPLLIVHVNISFFPTSLKPFTRLSSSKQQGRAATISYSKFLKYNIRTNGHALFYINTDKGLLTNHELHKQRIGGKPFFKIF